MDGILCSVMQLAAKINFTAIQLAEIDYQLQRLDREKKNKITRLVVTMTEKKNKSRYFSSRV
jgi:hypothetical protein